MSRRFQVRRRKTASRRIILLLVIAVLLCGIYELYQLLVPFHSVNPLWSEATIGQPVLDDWRYGGQDAEGYLEFYNKDDHPVLLPPDAHLFDANGRFIVLEGHTPSSITYALPINAIPVSWLAGGAALLVFPVFILYFRLRKQRNRFAATRKMRLKSSPKISSSSFKTTKRSRHSPRSPGSPLHREKFHAQKRKSLWR